MDEDDEGWTLSSFLNSNNYLLARIPYCLILPYTVTVYSAIACVYLHPKPHPESLQYHTLNLRCSTV